MNGSLNGIATEEIIQLASVGLAEEMELFLVIVSDVVLAIKDLVFVVVDAVVLHVFVEFSLL